MKRVGVTILVFLAAGLLLVPVVIVAMLARTPESVSEQALPPPPSTLETTLRVGALAHEERAVCQVRAEEVPLWRSGGEGLAVVTSLPQNSDWQWVNGQSGIEINARPIIGLNGSFPFFRDLRPGIEGRDVLQLQTALAEMQLLDAWDVDGVYGPKTSDAVAALYEGNGYEAPLTNPNALDLIDAARDRWIAAEAESRRQTEAVVLESHPANPTANGAPSTATPTHSGSGSQDDAAASREDLRAQAGIQLMEARDALREVLLSEGRLLPLREVVVISTPPPRLDLRGIEVGSTLSEAQTRI